ncbi:hypothetical protein POV27_08210 [Aureisphaera galaxeae]|nr:hypothetical protein [Aureisphaera galaxeae]MDC8004033.1 hypothetical protein [Aureisphaera galaxeae]
MKLKNYLFLVAFLGAFLFVSCTPENIEDEQQVETENLKPPKQG